MLVVEVGPLLIAVPKAHPIVHLRVVLVEDGFGKSTLDHLVLIQLIVFAVGPVEDAQHVLDF